MEVKIMQSEKGKDLLLIHGYKYSIKYISKSGTTSWRCTVKNCSGKMTTAASGVIMEKSHLIHNHDAEKNISRQQISNSLKRILSNDMLEKPSKLIRKAVASNRDFDDLTSQDIEQIRKSIYRSRKKMLPSLPKCTEDVFDALQEMDTKTNREESCINVFERVGTSTKPNHERIKLEYYGMQDDDDDDDDFLPLNSSKKERKLRHSLRSSSNSGNPSPVKKPTGPTQASINARIDVDNEFELFGKSIAVQLKKMPLDRALICQEKLQQVITQERLMQMQKKGDSPNENDDDPLS